jgi:hypothetical protein
MKVIFFVKKTSCVGDIEFRVVFVIQNLIKLQNIVLKVIIN